MKVAAEVFGAVSSTLTLDLAVTVMLSSCILLGFRDQDLGFGVVWSRVSGLRTLNAQQI